MLYNYKHMFNGFAASMTSAEAALLAGINLYIIILCSQVSITTNICYPGFASDFHFLQGIKAHPIEEKNYLEVSDS